MSSHGIIVLDKPRGMSSFEAARAVGRALGVKRVGHGGTLDPAASGVLLICLGEATKLAAFLQGEDKEYEAEIVFGVGTDTLDGDGRVTARADAAGLRADEVAAALPRFRGRFTQTPPMYSAVRREGRRLYELARAGIEVERAPRNVEVTRFDLLHFAEARARVRIICSKGTYVRVLAADLGAALGLPAHVSALRRTRSGPFALADAVELAFVNGRRPLDPAAALPAWPLVPLDAALERRARWGQPIPAAESGALPAGTRVRLVAPSGALVALAEVGPEGQLVPFRGFNYELTPTPTSAILPNN